MPAIKLNGKLTLFRDLPIVGGGVRDFDESVGRLGLQGGMKNLFTRHGNKLEIHGLSNALENILKKKPVVVIANHTYDIEPIALIAALPRRDNISVIGAAALEGIGPNLINYLIPIYVTLQALKSSSKLSAKLVRYFDSRIRLEKRLPDGEAARLNLQSINEAAKRVSDGGLIVMFPEGPRTNGENWFSGIGHLFKKLGVNTKSYYVRAYIDGTSNLDILRTVPVVGKLFPSVRVIFDDAQEVQNIFSRTEYPKEITQILQADYEDWVSHIKIP